MISIHAFDEKTNKRIEEAQRQLVEVRAQIDELKKLKDFDELKMLLLLHKARDLCQLDDLGNNATIITEDSDVAKHDELTKEIDNLTRNSRK